MFILNISLSVSPLAAPCFPLPPGVPQQMGRELITNQEGRTDANTHSSSSVNPSLLFLLLKLPAALDENLSHGMQQTAVPLSNASLFTEVMTKPSKTFSGCPQLSDLLSQQHDFSNEIVSQREEWNQMSGGWIKVVLALWDTGSDCRYKWVLEPEAPYPQHVSLLQSIFTIVERIPHANTWVCFKKE